MTAAGGVDKATRVAGFQLVFMGVKSRVELRAPVPGSHRCRRQVASVSVASKSGQGLAAGHGGFQEVSTGNITPKNPR
jgi:hypothetical protein